MKREFLFRVLTLSTIAAFLSLALSAAPKKPVYNVSTADEFLDALGSDRTIIIGDEDGEEYVEINITEALKERMERGEAKKKRSKEGYFWGDDNFDGPELILVNMENLTIQAQEDYIVVLMAEPRYANVMMFDNCENISLVGVTFGHTEEGYCDKGVLQFENCANINIERCDLYGCGTEGIRLDNVEGFTFSKSKIRDCSYYIMHVVSSENVKFIDSQFFRNREFDLVTVVDCDTVLFDNCIFANNQGYLFDLYSPVEMRDCVILHPDETMFDDDCEVYPDYVNCITQGYFNENGDISESYG